jgi:hypothetical protein
MRHELCVWIAMAGGLGGGALWGWFLRGLRDDRRASPAPVIGGEESER